jgi:hypothetical protein
MTTTNAWRTTKASVVILTVTAALTGPTLVSAQESSVPAQLHAQAQVPAPTQPTEEPTRPRGDATQGPAVTPAAPAEEKGPNTGRVGLVMGVDWLSAYYFRGIANEQNGGNNVQPWGEIGFRAFLFTARAQYGKTGHRHAADPPSPRLPASPRLRRTSRVAAKM